MGGVDPGGVMPGGNQPPFQHVPPPMFANGSGVVQPVGGVDPPDAVTRTASGDTLRMPPQVTDRTRK